MAALVKCRALSQSFRAQVHVISGVCGADSVLHAVLPKRAPRCVRLHSSEVKSGDELVVRHLDGADSGRARDVNDTSVSVAGSCGADTYSAASLIMPH